MQIYKLLYTTIHMDYSPLLRDFIEGPHGFSYGHPAINMQSYRYRRLNSNGLIINNQDIIYLIEYQ